MLFDIATFLINQFICWYRLTGGALQTGASVAGAELPRRGWFLVVRRVQGAVWTLPVCNMKSFVGRFAQVIRR
ncbi:MAG: hypothetical protein CMJ48_00395 [Planctomycetaceae bacterium]|nr:hypothetical protein [Planctomycetaceae bacterium]